MSSFDTRKKTYLDALYKPDKSKKGHVDEKVSPTINCLNELEDYVSTSSCSGRISLLLKEEGAKKHTSEWPYQTHGIADYNSVWSTLQEVVIKSSAKLWLKMESPILHIMCRNLESAQKLVSSANAVGFKFSGIFVSKKDRFMVNIMGCEKIETLVALDKKILVDLEYIRIVVGEANLKLAKSHERLLRFFEELKAF